LWIYAPNTENTSIPVTFHLEEIRDKERAAGLTDIRKYQIFSEEVKAAKRNILYFLIKTKRNKKSIVGYGAHAEAHTLLNYCGIGPDFLDYLVDRNPMKQGRFLAGVHIPILHPDKIDETKPDYLVILPWNIKKEIMAQMSQIGGWAGQFVVLVPRLTLYDSDGTEGGNELPIKEESE